MLGTTFKDVSDVISGEAGPKSDKNTELIMVVIGTLIGCGGILYTSIIAKRYFNEIIEQQNLNKEKIDEEENYSTLETQVMPQMELVQQRLFPKKSTGFSKI